MERSADSVATTSSVGGAAVLNDLSTSRTTTATTSRAMITPFSFLPVWAVIDSSRLTSFSRLMPSGVSSNAQANTTASGKPSISMKSTDFATQSGAPKFSNARSAICASTQATTP